MPHPISRIRASPGIARSSRRANSLRSALEQPARHALTLQSDPTFVTAWGAGNIVADPTRKSATEDLAAEGFGTLRARPRSDQNVEAVGVHETGAYRVQLRRRLHGGRANAVSFRPGSRTAVSFAAKHGLSVMYVTEDTVRAQPDHIRALYLTAIECGATDVVKRTTARACPGL